MDIKKESITINETVMRTNEKVLVNSDVIVPDVKSDIAKVLRIDADAIVESCNYTAGHIEIDGKIYLTIIYVPDNSERPVCSITTDIPFETQIEDTRLADKVKAVCGADVYNIEFNLLNSRKISVKTLVNLSVRALLPHTEEFVVLPDDLNNCQSKTDSAEIFSLTDLKNTKFTVEETLDFPSAKPSAVSILKTDVRLCDYQTHIITGKIIIKGNAETCLLYLSDEGKIEFINHEIPFTEVIDAPGANENTMCDLNLSVCVASSVLKADTDADMRLLNVQLLFCAEITAYEESKISLLADCFSCCDDIVCKQKQINFDKLAYKGETQKNIKTLISVGDKLPPVETVYNLMVKPYIEKVTAADGQINIKGSCDCYILYISSKESMPVCSMMQTSEFELNVNSNQITQNSICTATAQLTSASYNISVSGEIEVRACVNVEAFAINSYSKEFVCDIVPSGDNADKPKRHGMCVYFVKKGDTLWKIAKKYTVPLETLISLNNIDNPDLIQVGSPILIPLPHKVCN